MSETSYKKSLNNGVNKSGTESEGFSPGSCPVDKQHGPGCHPATARRKRSKRITRWIRHVICKQKKGPNIGYKKRIHQYWKDYGLFELESNTWYAKLGVF